MNKKTIGKVGLALSVPLVVMCGSVAILNIFALVTDTKTQEEKNDGYKIIAVTTILPTVLIYGSVYLLNSQ